MELKPCPFCGGEAIMETFETVRERKPRFRVKCSECWCETNWDNFSQEEAAEAWNKRVTGMEKKPFEFFYTEPSLDW